MASTLSDDFADEAAGPPADGKRPYLIYYDTEVKGFGLRVTKAGAKSFVLNYRADGVERRYTIGTFRDPWRVNKARKEAGRLKELIDQGGDPQGEKNTVRTAPTVNNLIERYLSDWAPRKRARSRKEDEGLIRQWIRPELGTRKLADVRPVHIEELHRKVSRRTPYRANRVLAVLSKMFNLAVRWEMRPDNPCRGIERNQERPRNRFLEPAEFRRLVEALARYPDQKVANVVRLLLLTGARSSEVFRAEWRQFDLARGVWTKPSAHTKQDKEHRVPISAPARQLLVEMKEAVDRQAREDGCDASPYVFPSDAGHLTTIRHDWPKLCKAAQISGVRVHDTRHSYAAYLASSGLSLPLIGGLLGHTQAATTARYAHLLDNPLREATERVGRLFVAAEKGKDADIVRLRRRRRL